MIEYDEYRLKTNALLPSIKDLGISLGIEAAESELADLKKQAEAGDRFTPDTLPAGAPHAEFVRATDAMNARLDALDLSEVEIEEIEDPKE